MKKSLLVVMLLVFLMVSDSEEGWVRRIARRVRRSLSRVRRSIRRVSDFVRKYRPVIYAARAIGKRSADDPCPHPVQATGGMSQEKAKQLLQELELSCPQFAIDPTVGLTKETVLDAFEATDVDNDNTLSDDELDQFEDVLEAYEACAEAKESKED